MQIQGRRADSIEAYVKYAAVRVCDDNAEDARLKGFQKIKILAGSMCE